MDVKSNVCSSQAEMQALLDLQKKDFVSEGFVEAGTRIARLNTAIDLIFDNKEDIVASLSKDFGNRSNHQSLMSDIHSTLETLKHNRKNLKRWMKDEKRKVAQPLALFGARAHIEYKPKGVIGILGTWNFPVNTVFSPLAGILAAGNRAIVKFSEVTPATAQLMESLIGKYFDSKVVGCVSGGPEIGAAFSSLAFDHIIFTGAGSIGKHVMRAAAENLTPVTLELGGKSPVIIGRDADLEDVATRVLTGKALNVGQVCLSPDYLFLPEESVETFMEHAARLIKDMFPTMLNNPDYSSVVSPRHHQRLLGYLADAREQKADVREINPAGEDFSQQQDVQKIPFTFVINPTDAMKIMQEEIFGPLIAVKSYQDVSECINYINAHPRPLGLYMFTHDKALQKRILDSTLSGGVTINDVIMHVSCEDVPFGGIGPSGMGSYHGIEGFKAFSHARAVYKQSKINLQKLGGMIPPYGDKCDKTLAGLLKK